MGMCVCMYMYIYMKMLCIIPTKPKDIKVP